MKISFLLFLSILTFSQMAWGRVPWPYEIPPLIPEIGINSLSSQLRSRSLVQTIGPYSGRILAVAIANDSSHFIYVATLGGVFLTSDQGNTWVWKSKGLGNGSLGTIGLDVDPQNSRHVIALTNDGIYETKDAGTTWRQRVAQADAAGDSDFSQWPVLFDPDGSGHIFVGMKGKLAISENNGNTWQTITSPVSSDANVYLLAAFDPNISGKLYLMPASIGKNDILTNPTKIFVSDDYGLTWNNTIDAPSNTDAFGGALAVDPRNSHTRNLHIYASTVIFNGENYKAQLWRVDVNQNNWQLLLEITGNNVGGKGYNYSQPERLIVDPVHPERLFFIDHNAFYASSDDGSHWSQKLEPDFKSGPDPSGCSFNVDTHDTRLGAYQNNIYLYFASDFGLCAASADSGSSKTISQSLPNTIVYDMSLDTKGNLYTGMQDYGPFVFSAADSKWYGVEGDESRLIVSGKIYSGNAFPSLVSVSVFSSTISYCAAPSRGSPNLCPSTTSHSYGLRNFLYNDSSSGSSRILYLKQKESFVFPIGLEASNLESHSETYQSSFVELNVNSPTGPPNQTMISEFLKEEGNGDSSFITSTATSVINNTDHIFYVRDQALFDYDGTISKCLARSELTPNALASCANKPPLGDWFRNPAISSSTYNNALDASDSTIAVVSNDSYVHLSSDKRTTWKQSPQLPQIGFSPAHHREIIKLDPACDRVYIVAAPGGIYYWDSWNNSSIWQLLDSGLGGMLITNIVFSPNAAKMYMSTEGNGVLTMPKPACPVFVLKLKPEYQSPTGFPVKHPIGPASNPAMKKVQPEVQIPKAVAPTQQQVAPVQQQAQ